MKKKLIAAMLTVAMASALLAGCGGSGGTSAQSGTQEQEKSEDTADGGEAEEAGSNTASEEDITLRDDLVYRVGFANIDDSDNCCYPAALKFKEYVESEEFAKSIGVDKVETLLTDSAGDIEKQTTNVETMLTKGVDMMFIIGVDTEGNTTAVEQCNAEGVPVFMVGTEASGGIWKFVGFDETQLGQGQGKWCADNLPENTKICYLEGTPGREAAVLRKEGFLDGIAQRDDLEVLSSQTGDFDTETAMQVTEDWIQAYGDDIGCIVAADGKMITGACEAVKAAALGDQVTTCGVVSVEDDAYLIEQGDEDYAIFVYWPSIGTLCGEIAEKVYKGEQVDARTNIELQNMTKDNVKELLADS